jgi:uncharacterized membrane protein YidH (DUF202 family)
MEDNKAVKEAALLESIPSHLIEFYERKPDPLLALITFLFIMLAGLVPVLTIFYPAAIAELGFGYRELIFIYGRSIISNPHFEGRDVYHYTANDDFSPIIKPFIIIGTVWAFIGIVLMGDVGRRTSKPWTFINLGAKVVTLSISILGLVAMSKFKQFIRAIDLGYKVYRFTITYYLLLALFIVGIIYAALFVIPNIYFIVKKEFLPITKFRYHRLKNRFKKRQLLEDRMKKKEQDEEQRIDKLQTEKQERRVQEQGEL